MLWKRERKRRALISKLALKKEVARVERELSARAKNDGRPRVHIVCGNFDGGSWRYLTDIMDHYKDQDYFLLTSVNSLHSDRLQEGDALLIQCTMNTDIPIAALSEAIRKNGLKTVIPLHDWYWFLHHQTFYTSEVDRTPCHTSYLRNDVAIRPEVRELFSLADVIIAPSIFVRDGYKRAFGDSIPIRVVRHNDYCIGTPMLYIPEIGKKVINMGMFSHPLPSKGIELVELLVRDFKKYKGYDINYKIVGKTIPLYPERVFFAHARTHRVHCFLYLNKWGETHCYALTKALATGIPIFYNNIGSFRERLGDKEWHFKNAESERAFPDLPGTIARFKICLDYIISRQGTGEFPSDISNTIEYRPFYDDLFEIPNPDSPSHIRARIL